MASAYGAGSGAEMLQSILRQKFAEAIQQQAMQQNQQRIAQEGERLKMAAADREAQMQDVAQSRAIQNAGRVAGALRIGQVVAPETVAALKGGNLGDLVQHEQADLPSTAISGIAQAGAKAPTLGAVRIAAAGRPERDTFTGTAEQQANEQTRQDVLSAREQARLDKIEAAKTAAENARALQQERLDTQRNIAQIAAGGRNANADLQREILQGKIDAAKEKEATTKQTADNARNAALASIDDTSSALDELLDEKGQLKKGASGAFGADSMLGIIPGTSYADAKARRERLQSRLTIDLLGEMKRQSRTGASGFGALSENELNVLQSAAARLGAAQSDESARQALLDVRKQLAGMRQRAAGGTGPAAATAAPSGAAPPRIRYDMNGNPIKD